MRLRLVDLGDMMHAQAALVMAQASVWLRRRGDFVSRGAQAAAVAAPTPAQLERARRFGVAVDRAARYGVFRPKCLARAVALHRMLERDGVRGSRVEVGVKLGGAKPFDAHAWVTLGGTPIGDRQGDTGAYVPLRGIRVEADR